MEDDALTDAMLAGILPDTPNDDRELIPRLTTLGFEAKQILARLERIKSRRVYNPFADEYEVIEEP